MDFVDWCFYLIAGSLIAGTGFGLVAITAWMWPG